MQMRGVFKIELSSKCEKKGCKEEVNSEILDLLLRDRTTEKNILWATNDYENILAEEQIRVEQLDLIQPRFKKNLANKKNRTRDKAEIFTPSWICNEQNNLIDEAWFGRSEVFNKVADAEKHTWQSTTEKIIFPEGRSGKDYVGANRLEIACGEAPYLVSRYDSVTGEEIALENRIGLLDRKLRVVGENVSDVNDWLYWTKKLFNLFTAMNFKAIIFSLREKIFCRLCRNFLKINLNFLRQLVF